MQNRLTVTIAGQKFSLVADEPEAYMKEIAALADQKIAEAKKLVGNTTFSTGVLATLNMADEAVKLRHQCEEYKNQAQEQQEALAKSKSELGLMQDELDTMRRARPDEDPAVLLAEIKRLEKELDTAHNLHDSVCAESDAEMARLNGQIDQLTRDRDQAKARLSDMDALQMRIQALTRETQELREELTRAQAEKAAAVHEQENSLQSEIEQLNAALDALHVKESTQSAEAQDQIDALNKQIESLNGEIEILRGARTDTEPLYAEIRNLQNALDAKEKQVSENIQLKEEIEGLKHKLVENDPSRCAMRSATCRMPSTPRKSRSERTAASKRRSRSWTSASSATIRHRSTPRSVSWRQNWTSAAVRPTRTHVCAMRCSVCAIRTTMCARPSSLSS